MSYRWIIFLSLFLIFFGSGAYGCKRVNPPSSEEVPTASPQPLPVQPETIPTSIIPTTQPSSPPSVPETW